MRTPGIHHIEMVAADARRTLRFYRDLLGLALVKRTVNVDDPGSHYLFFGMAGGVPGTLLTFREAPRGRKGGWGVGGVHHVALGVETEDALLKWKRRLTDAGVSVTGPYDRGYFTSIYFSDPDGQILEIATAGPGYLIDESAEELGRELRVPPERLLRGHRDEAAIAALTWPEPTPAITPDMVLDGIHHVSAITGDLDAAVDWYPDVLGLDLVKRTVNRDDGKSLHYFWAARDEQGAVARRSALTLFGWPSSRYYARPGVGQTRQVAYRARNDTELGHWVDHLRSKGLELSGVVDRRYFRTVHFAAPDGLVLGIATDEPGFLLDEPAEALGSSLMLPAELEPRRAEIEPALTPLS